MCHGVHFAAKKLKPYFQEHPITVVCTAPLAEIIGSRDASGRVAKWAIGLAPYMIYYQPRTAIKLQALADFLVDWAETQYLLPAPDSTHWRMHFDGSKMRTGLGAGVVLTSPKGDKLKYALQIHFTASNNVAEYEALIHGLRLAKELGIHLATGTPRMQTWRATASSCSNSVDILRGVSSSTCQETTTTKQIPWHKSAPHYKQYHPVSPFSASASRLSSLHQSQTPSLCRLPLKKSDPTQEPQPGPGTAATRPKTPELGPGAAPVGPGTTPVGPGTSLIQQTAADCSPPPPSPATLVQSQFWQSKK
ncbi:unnamed protein product [Triticum aestivum]|uniref:RNase H type-1 domain-containing protein n=1 Tax=Triticum aestivum TaxID=4565 RepID=A0A7H4LN49_WHEAT|nr:unnamed protein product [Triticum aestivum]